MSRPIVGLCIATFVFAASAVADISNLISSTIEGFGISQEFAVTRNKLATYFEVGDKPTQSQGMYARASGGGVRLTIVGEAFGAARVGPISMNDNGLIAFQGVSSTPDFNGIFAKSAGGGVLITVRGNAFGDRTGAPVVGADDTIYFRDTDGIYARSSGGGMVLTVRGQDFAQMSRPSVNSSGDIAFSGIKTDGTEGVFVQRAGGGMLLTVTGSNFKMSSGQPKIIDNKKGLLVDFAVGGSSTNELYKAELNATGQYDLTFLTHIEPGSPYSMNEAGTLLQRLGGDLVIHSPSTLNNFAPGYVSHTLVSVGDPLDGSTIAALAISDSSLLPDDEVAFWAQLENGTTGIYVASVPEPSSIAAIILGIAAMRTRRP
jgi:hypothetical protein